MEYEIVHTNRASYLTNEKPGADFVCIPFKLLDWLRATVICLKLTLFVQDLDGEHWEDNFEMVEAEMEGFVMVDDAIGEDFLLVDGPVTE